MPAETLRSSYTAAGGMLALFKIWLRFGVKVGSWWSLYACSIELLFSFTLQLDGGADKVTPTYC